MRKLFLFLTVALGLLAARPAHATFTYAQKNVNSSCGGVTSCSVTGFTAVPAGSLIFGVVQCSSTTCVPSAGTSGGGTWTVPSGCTTNTNCAEIDSTAGGVFVEYILSSTGSPTSLSCTATTAVIVQCEIGVYSFTGSSASFDIGAVRDASTAAANLAGVSVGTITGTNDLIVQYGVFSGNASGCPNSGTETDSFPNGNAMCSNLNTTSNTAGTYTNTSSRAALGAIAIKETGGAATVTGLDKRKKLQKYEP